MSIASITLANDLNVTMQRKWVIDAEQRDDHAEPRDAVPAVAPPASGIGYKSPALEHKLVAPRSDFPNLVTAMTLIGLPAEAEQRITGPK